MQFKRSIGILTFIVFTVIGVIVVRPLRAPGQDDGADMTRFMKNVVHLTVKFSNGDAEQGFGFIVGEDDLGTPDKPDVRLYVATANHVVRKDNPDVRVQEIKAQFCTYKLKSYAADLLDVFEPDLDFAVLEIPKPFPKFQWETNFFDPNPAAKTRAGFIGLQGKCLESGLVTLTGVSYKGSLDILDNQIQPGTSGAPLISNKGIIGLITRSEPGKAEAVNIDILRKFAVENGVPWKLQEFAALPTPTSPPPTPTPTLTPTPEPIPTVTPIPTRTPPPIPTATPTVKPTATPTVKPTATPTAKPTTTPTAKPRATPTPLPAKKGPAAGETWIDPITGMEFVWIEGGEFLMGCGESDIGCNNDEKPAHKVRVDGFWLGKYEVTQAQWQKIMGSNPSTFKGEDRPVETVSWEDAQEFIKKLNATHPHPSQEEKYWLPTEAEWEYAARAGTQTVYGFGDDAGKLGDYAWYAGNSGNQTHPVGQKEPNALGLYDMHGNVWEWTSDWHDWQYYSQSPAKDPQGPASGSGRVNRGGSWNYAAGLCRAARRYYYSPDVRGGNIGFRLVRTP